MQLDLFGSFPFPAGTWARKARTGTAIVVWIADPYEALQLGLAASLRQAGVTSRGVATEGTGYAYLLDCPLPVRLAILNQLSQPKNQGSQTAGNHLPW